MSLRKGKSLRLLETRVSRRSTCCMVLEDGWYISWRGGEYDGDGGDVGGGGGGRGADGGGRVDGGGGGGDSGEYVGGGKAAV